MACQSKRSLMMMLLLTVLIMFGFIGGCNKKDDGQISNTDSVIQNEGIEKDADVLCPLDQLPADEFLYQRPIAVMVENSPAARPQDGLAASGLVFEMPAEGGITRFMALYQHTMPKTVGPIRSARDYFIQRALEFDSIYVHCGQSPQAESMIQAGKVDNLNEMGLAKFFWRIKERKPPHNLYSSMEKLHHAASLKGYNHEGNFEPYLFSDFPMEGGIEKETIIIKYPNKYTVKYDYHASDNEYIRFMNGKIHADRITGEGIAPQNILIQYVPVSVIDSEGRLKVNMIGSGKGILFQSGKQYAITWEKQSEVSMTQYYKENGERITLIPGKTWIHVVDSHTVVE